MTAPNPEHEPEGISFLTNPAAAGLPADFYGMGVIRANAEGTGRKVTFLVDREYAESALTALRTLEGYVALSLSAVRWMREGWPECWGPGLDPTWNAVHPLERGL